MPKPVCSHCGSIIALDIGGECPSCGKFSHYLAASPAPKELATRPKTPSKAFEDPKHEESAHSTHVAVRSESSHEIKDKTSCPPNQQASHSNDHSQTSVSDHRAESQLEDPVLEFRALLLRISVLLFVIVITTGCVTLYLGSRVDHEFRLS